MTDLEKLMAEIAKRNGASQFSLNGGASPLGDGMAKAQSVFDAPQQMQGSVGVSPAQTEAQGQAQDDRSFFQKAGDFLGTNQLGNNIGSFIGSQKYGTGISADGEVTGRPLGKNTTPLFVLDPHSEAFFGKIRDFAQDGVNAVGDVAADLISESSGGRINLQSNQPVKNEVVGSNAGAISTPISSIDELNSLIYAPPEATAAQPAASQGQVAEAQPQAFSLPAVEIETPVVQSPNTQTRESITATGIGRLGLDPSVTGNGVGMVNPLTGEPLPFIQGVNGTMNQQASLPEGLTASSPIPEGLVKAIGSDGRMILTSPAEAARLNAIESQTQKDDRAAQQKFLASDKAREFSNRQIRSSIMGDGQYGRDSLAREARQAARPDFGEAQTRAAGTVTDRDRRAARGEGISDADRRDIAKANMRGASAGDVARGMKIADLNGLDLRTGQPVQAKNSSETDLDRKKKEAEIAEIYAGMGTGANPTTFQKATEEQLAKDLSEWPTIGRAQAAGNLASYRRVIAGLTDGSIETRGIGEFLPTEGLSEFARKFSNVPGQQALGQIRGVIFQGLRDTLGAQFTEREGQRLVAATYDPALPEADNIERLKHASAILEATIDARDNLYTHMADGGSVANYDGKRGRGIFDEQMSKLEQSNKNQLSSGTTSSGAVITLNSVK